MTEPTYDDFYPEHPKSGMTPDQEAEYNQLFPGTFPAVSKPDALTALTQALEAIEAGNHYPKENN